MSSCIMSLLIDTYRYSSMHTGQPTPKTWRISNIKASSQKISISYHVMNLYEKQTPINRHVIPLSSSNCEASFHQQYAVHHMQLKILRSYTVNFPGNNLDFCVEKKKERWVKKHHNLTGPLFSNDSTDLMVISARCCSFDRTHDDSSL